MQISEEALKEGVICPCCDRLAKMYKYPLHSHMAQKLGELFRHERRLPGDWVKLVDLQNSNAKLRDKTLSTGNVTYLRHWELIEARPNVKRGKKPDGWRITEKGFDFVYGKIVVPTHIYIYAGKCFGFSDKFTTFKSALGKDFDLNELLNDS